MPCDDLEGWDGEMGWRLKSKGNIYVCLQLITIVLQQKPTQHCKAIILQLKKNFNKRENKQTQNLLFFLSQEYGAALRAHMSSHSPGLASRQEIAGQGLIRDL